MAWIYIIRLVWLAAVMFTFMGADTENSHRYRGWLGYLLGTCCIGVLYWPELLSGGTDDWLDIFWPLLLVVLVFRGVSLLEALHCQTCRFPFWSRMMLGVFLLVSGLVLAVFVWRHTNIPINLSIGSVRDQFIRFRRYAQLWIGLVALLTPVFYFGVRGQSGRSGQSRRSRRSTVDHHSLIVGLLSLSYGVTGLIDMTIDRSPLFVTIQQTVTFLVDAALYVAWGFWVAPRISRVSRLYPKTTFESLQEGRLCDGVLRLTPQIGSAPDTDTGR